MEEIRFSNAVLALEPQMLAWRRHLHAYPERSFEEVETTAFLERELLAIGVDKIERPTKTGLVARVFGSGAGKPAVVGVRADIDALPMPEENDLPYRSTVEGVMHACGHDGHAAMLLALAKLLVNARTSFCGEARLIFQHAEELPPGGAVELLRAGAVEGVDAMLGLHLSSNFDTGVFGVKSGVLTAAVDRFNVLVRGRGGHCAFPEQCNDPVVAAAETVLALQTIVSRRVAAGEPAVVSVCEVHAGTAYNIIPNEARLTASVRSFGAETRALLEREARRVAEGVARAHGCESELIWEAGYPSVVNDEHLTRFASARIEARFGKAKLLPIGCIMPGEDYAYFLEGRPGFFVELGTRNTAKGCDAPHHNPHYRLDEDALRFGLQYEYDMVRALLDGTRAALER